jgi:hypothetical protein
MMKIAFDLISDLNLDHWDQDLDWTGCATSPVCVIAGGVTNDLERLHQFLTEISQAYQGVMFIDGSVDHENQIMAVASHYAQIKQVVNSVKDVVFLQDNVVVLNGVAILATNGWWTWDFAPEVDTEQAHLWFCDQWRVPAIIPPMIQNIGVSEARYLTQSVARLQMHHDVQKIVVVTNAVPDLSLVQHDINLMDSFDVSIMGNPYLLEAVAQDTEQKISHWCVGRYPGMIDTVRDRIRFVSNCRGRPDRGWCQWAYHPLRIEVDVN